MRIAKGGEQGATHQRGLLWIKHLPGSVFQPLQDVFDRAHVAPPAALGSIVHAPGLLVGFSSGR